MLNWDLEKGLLESGTFTFLLHRLISYLSYLFRQQFLLMCYITKQLMLIRTTWVSTRKRWETEEPQPRQLSDPCSTLGRKTSPVIFALDCIPITFTEGSFYIVFLFYFQGSLYIVLYTLRIWLKTIVLTKWPLAVGSCSVSSGSLGFVVSDLWRIMRFHTQFERFRNNYKILLMQDRRPTSAHEGKVHGCPSLQGLIHEHTANRTVWSVVQSKLDAAHDTHFLPTLVSVLHLMWNCTLDH